jgi:hypothetical protein
VRRAFGGHGDNEDSKGVSEAKMRVKVLWILLVSLFPIVVISEVANSQTKNDPSPQFKVSRSGLEVSDYKKVVLVTELEEYYDENVGAGKIGLTEAMIRRECESRLKEAALEPLSGFVRPEYLSVKVSIRYRSFYISIQFIRPASYRVEETQFTKYGAITWQRILTGQHGYAPEYILENLGILFDEYTKEYLKANSN